MSVFKRDQVGWGAQDCITQCQICPEGVRHGFVCRPSLFPLPALSILHSSTLFKKKGPSSQIMCLVCPSDNSFFAIVACVCVCVCVCGKCRGNHGGQREGVPTVLPPATFCH